MDAYQANGTGISFVSFIRYGTPVLDRLGREIFIIIGEHPNFGLNSEEGVP